MYRIEDADREEPIINCNDIYNYMLNKHVSNLDTDS